jgi:VanZ family protein
MIFLVSAWRWVLVLLWMLMIFLGSSVPSSSMPSAHWLIPVSVHIVEYLMLSALVLFALISENSGLSKFAILALAFVFSVFYGVTDEAHQLYVAGRVPDMLDLLADSIGAVLGCSALFFWQMMRTNTKTNQK